jgi:putative salt-induced outer membrane protein
VKAGPAWRKTRYISQPLESVVTGLGAVNAKWKLSRAVSLTEDASALTGAQNTNVTSLTSLSARLNGALSARTSYQVTYNSNPPDTYKTLDTITRFTLVYGF